MAITYSTWNPLDKNANLALSNGNLTATSGVNNNYKSIRSTVSVTSGKWYWEYVFAGAVRMSGVANSSASLSNFIGSDADGWGYFQDGDKYNNGSGSAYGASYTTETIGIALDMDGGSVTMYKDNVSQGTMFTGITGTIFAAMSIDTNGTAMTANFGATALTYSPPGGFNAGLYTGTADATLSTKKALLGVGK